MCSYIKFLVLISMSNGTVVLNLHTLSIDLLQRAGVYSVAVVTST